MAEDGGNLSGTPDSRGSEGRSSLPRTFIRLNDLSGDVAGGGEERTEVMVEPASPAPDGTSSAGDEESACGEESLPYPTLAPVVFFYMKQSTRPRSWCLKMVCNPYPFKNNKNQFLVTLQVRYLFVLDAAFFELRCSSAYVQVLL
uniref:Uncharacterized protein n=1 Tax=Hippocampus comes TaxID=109280 RepID=A0A3Q2Y305_HIPCM